jgi:hypothetical protein
VTSWQQGCVVVLSRRDLSPSPKHYQAPSGFGDACDFRVDAQATRISGVT